MTLETGRKKDDLAALKTLNPKPTVKKVENQSTLKNPQKPQELTGTFERGNKEELK